MGRPLRAYDELAREVKTRLDAGKTYDAIAAELRVSKPFISKVRKGEYVPKQKPQPPKKRALYDTEPAESAPEPTPRTEGEPYELNEPEPREKATRPPPKTADPEPEPAADPEPAKPRKWTLVF